MRHPKSVLANGTRMRTHAKLSETSGMTNHAIPLRARRMTAAGTIAGMVPGHDGTVSWVRHPLKDWVDIRAGDRWREFELEKAAA